MGDRLITVKMWQDKCAEVSRLQKELAPFKAANLSPERVQEMVAQLAAPLPEEVEALIRRVQGREDCYDEVVQMLGRLARQVAEKDAEIAAQGNITVSQWQDKYRRELAKRIKAEKERDEILDCDRRNEMEACEHAERAEAERDALRKALTDPVGRVDMANESRPYVHFVRLREPRQDEVGKLLFALAAQSPPPSAAAAVDQEDAQRGGL